MPSPHAAGRNGSAFMDNESEGFDRGASSSSLARVGGLEAKPEPAAYRFEDIGYEAADPALQTSLWHESMTALCAGPDRRRGSRMPPW
jgi:hypothetical protein